MLLSLFAKVLGVTQFLYQRDSNPDAKAVIEVTGPTGFFQTSTKNRVVEFYSPYCVGRAERLTGVCSFACA